MHDASSGLGLISVDLAGVCVGMYSCEAVRGGQAVVPFVRNGSQAGPMTRSALAAAGRSEEKNVDSVVSYALPFDFSESRTALVLDVGREYSGNIAEIFSNSEFLLSSKINRKGHVKILKRSSDGKLFSRDVNSKNDIEIFLKNC